MYKRWLIEQDSATGTRINWLKRFFTEFEKILTEIGIEFKSYYNWTFTTNTDTTNSLNCVSSKLGVLTPKGYPEWAVNFTSYPNINLSDSNNINIWKTTAQLQNYINGFLTFKIENIEYCLVYRLGIDDVNYGYSDLLILVKYNNEKMYSQTIDSASIGTSHDVPPAINVVGIGKWGTGNHILVEYHKNEYINMLNLTLNGLTTNTSGDYYSDGKFISLGTYKLSDDMTMCFPAGFLAKTDNLDSTMFNKLCFVTDSQGLTTLINGNLGDQITGEYIKGNVYFGIKNTRILGKLENAITINNYNFETGTIFTYNSHRYGKIKIPMINNEVCVSTDYTKYGAALSLAFHKDIYEDTKSNQG
jgi:hypothetical protein